VAPDLSVIQPILCAGDLAQVGAVMMLTRAAERVTIPNRFNGPAGSANGGYVGGLLAALIEGPARVVLHRPPPLDVELLLEARERGVVMRDGDSTIATATTACIELDPPKPPTFGEAVAASAAFAGFNSHPFSTCFVCGPRRASGDGLRIFPGPLSDEGLVAAPWIPGEDLADGQGLVRPEYIWAALDCPTGWVTTILPPHHTVVVLGTLAVENRRRLRAGRRHVLAAWPLGSEGRKLRAGAALWSDQGELHAIARATWIEVSSERWSE